MSASFFYVAKNKNRILYYIYQGGDYTISVARDEILYRFAGITTMLSILHKLYPAISC